MKSSRTNYSRGRAFEYRIKKYFEELGYFVVRSAGSHSVADLVAMRVGSRPVLVQCKSRGRVSGAEKEALLKVAMGCGADAATALRKGRRVEIHVLREEDEGDVYNFT